MNQKWSTYFSTRQMSYQIFDPEVNEPLHKLSKDEARKHFNLYIENINTRIQELEKLTILEGIKLNFTLKSVEKLDMWFPENIKSNPAAQDEPDAKSFSICNDLAMYFGEILKKKNKKITWELNCLRKNDISYHRPILTNFLNIKNKKYYIDFDLILCQYAFRILKGKIEVGLLKKMVESAIEKAG